MGRKSAHNLPPGIYQDQHGIFWATLEGEAAKAWREQYPHRTLPRRKANSLKEALARQHELIQDLARGHDPNAENPSLYDWLTRWLERPDITVTTRRRYSFYLTKQIVPFPLGRLRLRQIKHAQISVWVKNLTSHPSGNNSGKSITPTTIDGAYRMLRAALNDAVGEGLIVSNPCQGVKLPRKTPKRPNPLTPDEVRRLLNLLDTYECDQATGRHRPHRNAALYHVAVKCGLRSGELLALRWRDVDLERRELRVEAQIQNGQRMATKTERSRRRVPLPSDLILVLRQHRQNQQEETAIAGPGWNADDLLFVTSNGTPYSQSNLWRQLQGLLREAQLAQRRVHDLRHTYAALSIAAGIDILTLSRRMGHETFKMTADIYGHLYDGHGDDVDAIDALLRKEV